MSKLDQYIRDGYIILRNVVPKEYIGELRRVGLDLLEEKRKAGQLSIYTGEYVKHEKLMNVLFLKDVVEAIRDVLGEDYVTLTQFSLTANAYSPVWHTDSQSQMNAEYLFHKDYLISKCGLYLQEHDPVYGGSLEIIPYSHRATLLGYKSYITRKSRIGRISSLQWRAIELRNKYLLRKKLPKLNLGDVLLFHGLLVHRASQPDFSKVVQIEKYGIKEPPIDKYKFMIQWEVSSDNDFVPVYLAHQKLRALKEGKLYSESSGVKYPDDYPVATRQLVEANRCKIINYDDVPDSFVGDNNIQMKDGTPVAFLYR
jgi:Phytanoyl-CoA dioxygenase (PhyH)